jgi:cytochrome c553
VRWYAERSHQYETTIKPSPVQASTRASEHDPRDRNRAEAASIGRPGGQLAPYLATQLKSWQQGTRKNDAGNLMQSVASRLGEADIAAVTSYYASLGSP